MQERIALGITLVILQIFVFFAPVIRILVLHGEKLLLWCSYKISWGYGDQSEETARMDVQTNTGDGKDCGGGQSLPPTSKNVAPRPSALPSLNHKVRDLCWDRCSSSGAAA